MKFLVAIARLCVTGMTRQEHAWFLTEATTQQYTDPQVRPLLEDIVQIPVAAVPTPVARHRAVKAARQRGCDFLFMLDDDQTAPEGFFKTAFLHLVNSKEPCVIGAPYVSGGPEQKVQAFHAASPRNGPNAGFAMENIPREDAARRTGIERVCNLGTGCIAMHTKVFDVFEEHYKTNIFFDYSYNADRTEVTETEDCYLLRHLFAANVPLYVSWDHWAPHFKVMKLEKPACVERNQINAVFLAEAKACADADARAARAVAERLRKKHVRPSNGHVAPGPLCPRCRNTGDDDGVVCECPAGVAVRSAAEPAEAIGARTMRCVRCLCEIFMMRDAYEIAGEGPYCANCHFFTVAHVTPVERFTAEQFDQNS